MGFSRRLSTEEQERLLAGSPRVDGGELDEVAAFVRALPAHVAEEPNPVLAATLVPRLAEAARTGIAPTQAREAAPAPRPLRIGRPRRVQLARVAVAVALLPAFTAALAFAGVEVPRPAQDAFEGIGVELPNQSSKDGDEQPADQQPADEPSRVEDDGSKATQNGHGKGNGPKKPAKNVPKGQALGHEKSPAKGGTPPGQANGLDKPRSEQGNQGNKGGSGSSKGKSKGSDQSKAKKTPSGQAKKPPKPPPEPKPAPQGKGDSK